MAIEVGSKLSGKVTGITKFGAFVDLGDNQSGLVHISEVSNTFVKDIHDILAVGDVVNVLVTKIADDGKIALSIRRLETESETTKPSVRREKSVKTDNSYKKHHNEKENKSTSDFDAMMSAFLKDSDDRLNSLKRNTEGKRGGRGGRRS